MTLLAKIGMGRGWQVAPAHFAEPHGLIVLIALVIFARRRLTHADRLERARIARDYSYFHLSMIAGIVLFALGLKTTLHHVGTALDAG
jgi:low temperature requirement protein LtrA